MCARVSLADTVHFLLISYMFNTLFCRFQNYMVAMINKSVLPSKLVIPIVGDVNVLSKLLVLNIEFILFRGPFACFENSWHLKPEFKRQTKRNELAAQLSRHIVWFALLNLIFAPIIFLWQVLFFFFSYAAVRMKFSCIEIQKLTNLHSILDFEEGTQLPGNENLV